MCKWCKSILDMNYPKHGYGLTVDQARRVTKTPQLADFVEEAVHWAWKENCRRCKP